MSTPDTTIRIAQRLRDADAALAGDGLHIPTFAAQHGLSGKTIQRLLTSLRELGHAHSVHVRGGGTHWHKYDSGVGPLFAATIAPAAPVGRKRSAHNVQIAEMYAAGKTTAEIVAAFPELSRPVIDSTLMRLRRIKRP